MSQILTSAWETSYNFDTPMGSFRMIHPTEGSGPRVVFLEISHEDPNVRGLRWEVEQSELPWEALSIQYLTAINGISEIKVEFQRSKVPSCPQISNPKQSSIYDDSHSDKQ